MTISVAEEVNASRERIWGLITNPDAWTDMISGIISVDVIDRPQQGVIGLKWREKRLMFGKEAEETMWVIAAEPMHWYETRAENHGMIYTTRMSIDEVGDKTVLSMTFSAAATTFAAKLMSLLAFLFNGALRKALKQDLMDIRQTAETV